MLHTDGAKHIGMYGAAYVAAEVHVPTYELSVELDCMVQCGGVPARESGAASRWLP